MRALLDADARARYASAPAVSAAVLHNDPTLFRLYKAMSTIQAGLARGASADRAADKRRLATLEDAYFEVLSKVHGDTRAYW